jgi:hypothetical protein
MCSRGQVKANGMHATKATKPLPALLHYTDQVDHRGMKRRPRSETSGQEASRHASPVASGSKRPRSISQLRPDIHSSRASRCSVPDMERQIRGRTW